jgi:tRNA1Val (adenine37-N6)-methyltransferase
MVSGKYKVSADAVLWRLALPKNSFLPEFIPKKSFPFLCSMIFRFRKFDIHHDRSLLKVNTDAVLLGASIEYDREHGDALEIGTGCGLISLMMAQRFPGLKIDAIEPHFGSFEDASQSFSESSFYQRLKAFPVRLQEFAPGKQYDLIFTNPPYFEVPDFGKGKNLQDISAERKLYASRHTLDFNELLENAIRLLKPVGRLWVILPEKESTGFITLASGMKLHPESMIWVKNREELAVIRNVISFAYNAPGPIKERIITLYETGGSRHKSYRELTEEFYL